MQAHHLNLAEFLLNPPTVNLAYSPVAVMTVATAKNLMQSQELLLSGAQKLFNPAVWPQLEPEIERIPFDRQKAQCFRDCVAYLMAEATTLRSERRHIDALKHMEAALMLEALTHGGYDEVPFVSEQ
ncbi:hypothetical protein [Acaryochloris marina]|uniref:Uncharacterized protein n=1 Tax=Acaryochloris marina (strain MBIC 11017) TaxID=329726 RepID=A8ZPH5_ACAM1|nr:hypothetical protein [Acaryochloris marina]ABW32911.1 hypothetical protein AM1_E0142 [Acaryochloris marina MBIC11017]